MYFAGAYEDMNALLRGADEQLSGHRADRIKRSIKEITEDTKPLLEDWETYRAMPDAHGDIARDLFHCLETGDHYVDGGFVSTSANIEVTIPFAGRARTKYPPILLQVRTAKGNYALVDNMEELEMVLPPGTKFKVTDYRGPLDLEASQMSDFIDIGETAKFGHTFVVETVANDLDTVLGAVAKNVDRNFRLP